MVRSFRTFTLWLVLASLGGIVHVAEAQLEVTRSDPGPSAIVSRPPQRITLTFSGPVDLNLTRISLSDARGLPLGLSPVLAEQSNPKVAKTEVDNELGAGTYVVNWSTSTLEGKVSKGQFQFRVLGPNETLDSAFSAAALAAMAQDSAAREAASKANPYVVQSEEAEEMSSINPLRVFARALTYAAFMCIVGAAAVRFFVVPRVAEMDKVAKRRFNNILAYSALIAVVAYLVVAFVRLYTQPVLVGGLPTSDLSLKWAMVNSTDWGAVWLTKFIAALLALVGLALAGILGALAWSVVGIASVVLAVGTALTLHGSPRLGALAVAVESIHALAISAWFGGLFWILTVGFLALRSEGEMNVRRVGALVRAFAPTALTGAIITMLSGFASACIRVGSANAFIHTNYGIVMLVKLVTVILVAVPAFVSWRSSRIASSVTTVNRFATSSTWELALTAIVLLATAVLAAIPVPA